MNNKINGPVPYKLIKAQVLILFSNLTVFSHKSFSYNNQYNPISFIYWIFKCQYMLKFMMFYR